MANSLQDFGRRMRLRGQSVVAETDQLTRKVALGVLSTVTSSTPVDTGRARSNWLVALDAPRRDVVESYGPEGAADAATAEGSAIISNYRNGQAIYLTNNLAYIGRLNDGWSAQAPAGFVETAVAEAVRIIGQGQLVVASVGR